MIKLIIHWQKAKLPAWTDTMEALILACRDYGKAGHGIWDTSSSTMSAMSTELIPSSINIIKIHIYSWLCALFSFPPSLRRVWSLRVLWYFHLKFLSFLLRHSFELLIGRCCSVYIFLEKHFDRKLKQVVISEYTSVFSFTSPRT